MNVKMYIFKLLCFVVCDIQFSNISYFRLDNLAVFLYSESFFCLWGDGLLINESVNRNIGSLNHENSNVRFKGILMIIDAHGQRFVDIEVRNIFMTMGIQLM